MRKIKELNSNIHVKSLKKLYEKCKPFMFEKFGRILSYDEFIATLAYAHKEGLDQ